MIKLDDPQLLMVLNDLSGVVVDTAIIRSSVPELNRLKLSIKIIF